jgi:hypothetical protein
MSIKTGPLEFTPFREDSGIFRRFASLVDRWLQTFRNIVMPPSPRCFNLALEDEDTAILETTGTAHPRTSRRSHSRRLLSNTALRGNSFTGSKQLTAWHHTHSLTHTRTYTYTHTHIHSPHTHAHTLTRTHSYTTHTHTHTHTTPTVPSLRKRTN